ncbi:hypothetical protein [Roseivirga thermotolerans]|uniref:Redox-active disulfide protein 2 n=1 Tax=Roseivirga thermotolerans TaxID=1758176 RepID=A0ABQ3I7Q2_9BACT|nr:hypothetical protein [Roseivirga thermotolerans]GHE62325.1 hypothetical protein GCM10011340_16860 [Roseivirga thermotolerans]
MNGTNEYSEYSKEELNAKLNKFKRLQKAITIAAILAAVVIVIVSYLRNAPQGYKMAPIFLIVGIGYPYLAFGGIKTKIQLELENRSKS